MKDKCMNVLLNEPNGVPRGQEQLETPKEAQNTENRQYNITV